MSKRGLILWGVYAVFAGAALFLNWHASILDFGGPYGLIKLLVWAALIGFFVYSVYCSSREDLFRSLGGILSFLWGRQITLDLYLGLSIGIFIIYLNEGATAVLFWLIPLLAFVNLAFLLYIAIHFESIVLRFLA